MSMPSWRSEVDIFQYKPLYNIIPVVKPMQILNMDSMHTGIVILIIKWKKCNELNTDSFEYINYSIITEWWVFQIKYNCFGFYIQNLFYAAFFLADYTVLWLHFSSDYDWSSFAFLVMIGASWLSLICFLFSNYDWCAFFLIMDAGIFSSLIWLMWFWLHIKGDLSPLI